MTTLWMLRARWLSVLLGSVCPSLHTAFRSLNLFLQVFQQKDFHWQEVQLMMLRCLRSDVCERCCH